MIAIVTVERRVAFTKEGHVRFNRALAVVQAWASKELLVEAMPHHGSVVPDALREMKLYAIYQQTTGVGGGFCSHFTMYEHEGLGPDFSVRYEVSVNRALTAEAAVQILSATLLAEHPLPLPGSP